MDHESIRMVVCQKFAELLNRPFRRGMIGYIDKENPAGANLHRDEDVNTRKVALTETKKSQATIALAWLPTNAAQR